MSHLSVSEACQTIIDTVKQCTQAGVSADCLNIHAQLAKLQTVYVQCDEQQLTCRQGSCTRPSSDVPSLETPIPGLEHRQQHGGTELQRNQSAASLGVGGKSRQTPAGMNGGGRNGNRSTIPSETIDSDQPKHGQTYGAEIIVRNCLKVRDAAAFRL